MAESKSITEIWKPCPGFETHYEVSNMGRVRRVKSARGSRGNIILKPMPLRQGYLSVQLGDDGISGKPRRRRNIHRLVAIAFLGPQPEGHEVNHKDGNKKNNREENLEWATRSENIRHALRIGLSKISRGEDANGHKLTESKVKEIRKLLASGESQLIIAKRFGVGGTTICNIHLRKTWSHI